MENGVSLESLALCLQRWLRLEWDEEIRRVRRRESAHPCKEFIGMFQRNRIRLAMWTAVLAVGFAPIVQAKGPEKVTSVEGITEYRLDNGMKVLLFPEPSRPKVTVNLTVLVGSRHEGYGETGMAHLLEHMVFKGTPDHPDIPGALKQRGCAIQRVDVAGPDELFRNAAGVGRQPGVRDRAGGGSDGQLADQGRGPGDRVLGGAERV